MPLATINDPESVRKAIKEFDELGRVPFLQKYGFAASLRYALRSDGRLYDSKAIAGVAHGYEFPGEGSLPASGLSGGVGAGNAATKLTDLGFEILDLDTTRPRVWIEKAHVRGRAYRISGPLRLGAAVWSPKTSAKGTDIYRFLRDVEVDDYVLHFTDGEGFTAVSRASSKVEDLDEVPAGIESAGREHQVVWLSDSQPINPPLTRETLFASETWDRLSGLLDIGVRHNFYSKAKELNQGHYFTPAMPDLVQVLNETYEQMTGKPLVPWSNVPGTYSGGGIGVTSETGGNALATFINLSAPEADELVSLLEDKKQLILEGPPGSGKTWVAGFLARYFTGNPLVGKPADKRVELLQFHQTYGYEDFVQGIRPRTTESGALDYRTEPGKFIRFCSDARKDPRPHVLIIDEINRGNISRIFGELLMLLEYRDQEVELPYSEPGAEKFGIPENVYIIGTMNTADRSLSQIDYALRRRFFFYPLSPVEGDDAPILRRWLAKQPEISAKQAEEVIDVFVALNKRLREDPGEDFYVGHSYFMRKDVASPGILERVWRRSVEPLLREYFHNRKDRRKIMESFGLSAIKSAATAKKTGLSETDA